MAEYLLRKRLGTGSRWTAESAGVAAMAGLAASAEAIAVLAERGIDMNGHLSRPADEKQIASASLVVVMTASHAEQLRELFPRAVDDKVFVLKSFGPEAGGDIEDPIGMSLEAYRAVRDEIGASLPGLMEFMETLK